MDLSTLEVLFSMCMSLSVLLAESRGRGKEEASYVALTPISRTHAIRLAGVVNQRYGSFTGVPDQLLLSNCCLGNIFKVKLNPMKQVLRARAWIGISGFGAELVLTLNYQVTHSSNIY